MDAGRLERQIVALESCSKKKNFCFSVPGSCLVSSCLDVARTIARRAERRAVSLLKKSSSETKTSWFISTGFRISCIFWRGRARMLKLKKALLIADPQVDFCPGGALGIKDGDKIIPAVNAYVRSFAQRQLPIFITRDWHPKRTTHFKAYGGIWPKHCVHDTKGAAFHPGLRLPKEAIILSKGMDPHKDSYSAFHAYDYNHKELHHLLQIFGVTELYIGGLATDYCVKYSVLDA
jgi:nicotinamidase/pyrazinamidase